MRSALAGIVVAALVAGCTSDRSDVAVVSVASVSPTSTSPSVGGGTTAPEPSSAGTTSPDTEEPATNPTDASGPDTSGPDTTVADSTQLGTTAPNTGDGHSGVGDRLYPDLGNPGLDVAHYAVDVTYQPKSRDLQGHVELSITATADLSDFTLDELDLDVAAVTVNGKKAAFTATDPELHITPSKPIAKGDDFTVAVTYSTTPVTGRSPATDAGWFPTDTGAYTVDEPDGTRMWMPSNDHPTDKATFDVTMHVPKGLTAVANGTMTVHTSGADGETWSWKQDQPMATYLTQVIIGPYAIVDTTGPHGLPLSSVVLTQDKKLMQPFIDDIGPEITYFEQFFGPFPFDNYGIAMADSEPGLAMEEQGRSLFSREDFVSGQLGGEESLLLSHELAHQWFGDAVSPAQWQDIWLNESFATYGQWMWLDHLGELDIADEAQRNLDNRHDGGPPTGKPGIADLFSYDVYDGGAVVLQALRDTVGDTTFFGILQHWAQDNRFEARTSADFIELASKLSGKDLTKFFDDWLYASNLPDSFPN